MFQGQTRNNIHGLPLVKLPASTKYIIEDSNRKTRGWTFQEELCSQRLLVLLPYCAVFACASALCREDLCFEAISSFQNAQDSEGSKDSRDGLTLLSVTLRSLVEASPERQITLFQGLVKQYLSVLFQRRRHRERICRGQPYASAVHRPIIPWDTGKVLCRDNSWLLVLGNEFGSPDALE